jgi:hypothetical protein
MCFAEKGITLNHLPWISIFHGCPIHFLTLDSAKVYLFKAVFFYYMHKSTATNPGEINVCHVGKTRIGNL